jgi:predicted O-methyltransferase YrrM
MPQPAIDQGMGSGDGLAPVPVTAESLARLLASAALTRLERRFQTEPASSLVLPKARALLYGLVRMLDADEVLEIGTLFCGTTEVLAHALVANGHGQLHTVDPYGGERCPPIIGAWRDELRARVRFYPEDSMAFLQRCSDGPQHLAFDLAFIDGCHNYEAVLHDVSMAARVMKPGGIMVLDDAIQSGPFEAARRFLADERDWRDLGQAFAAWSRQDPFASRRGSFPEANFIILGRGPGLTLAPSRIVASGHTFVDRVRIDGLRVRVLGAAAPGRLHYNVFLREFADGNRRVEEQVAQGSIDIGAEAALDYRMPAPLVARMPESFGPRQATELELCWQPSDGASVLRLEAMPALLP